jgi:hypothetical protein
MAMTRRVGLVALGLLACNLGKLNGDFSYASVADSTTFQSFGPYPSMNAAGTVVFQGTQQSGAYGIFSGSGGPVTVIASLGSPYGDLSLGGSPSINASGAVAFQGQPAGGGDALYLAAGGSVKQIASNLGGSQFSGFATPSINNSNQVAFVAGFGAGVSVFRYDNGTFTRIADNSSFFEGFANNLLAINDAGSVAFFSRFPLSTGQNEGLFVGNGASVITIAETGGIFTGLHDRRPSINGAGQAAFGADLAGGGQGIFVGSGGSLQSIADTNGVYAGFQAPVINDRGQVAFWTTLKAGGGGIFTGNDPNRDKVIATGDSLFGSTVVGFATVDVAENNDGQIAFFASLADGRTELVVATPVPEPSGLSMCAAGAVGTIAYAWRRRKPVTRRRSARLHRSV